MSKNTQQHQLSSNTQEIFNNVFTVIPTLKDMYEHVKKYNQEHDKPLTIAELFKKTMNYTTDTDTFPQASVFASLVGQKIAQVYNNQELGKKYEQQLLNTSSVLNTQVHFSLLRNFDFYSSPGQSQTYDSQEEYQKAFIQRNRLNEDGTIKPNEHYNSVIFNSEVLWIALCQHFGISPLSLNYGGISGSNETSAAYLQYGSHPESSLRIINGKFFNHTMCYTFNPEKEHYEKILHEQSKATKPSERKTPNESSEHKTQHTDLYTEGSARNVKTLYYLKELQEYGFSHGVSRVYAQQLNDLFEVSPDAHAIEEINGIQNQFLAHLIEDSSTLTHYIYTTPSVYKLFLDCYSGISTGWDKLTLDDGTIGYNTIYTTKPTNTKKPELGKKSNPAIGFIYHPETQEGYFPEEFSPEKLAQGLKDGSIIPQTIQFTINEVLEAGIIAIGGVAQINYNKCVVENTKKFFSALKEGIEQNKYPPLPEALSFDNLDKRMQLIEENQTPITLAGFGIIPGEKSYEIGHYGPFIEGEKLPQDIHEQIMNMDAQKAIERMILALHEYKLGNKGFNRLVGDQHISLAQRELSAEEKERFITETGCVHPAFTQESSLSKEPVPVKPIFVAKHEQKTLDNKRSREL